jgi:hypothetical protein
MGNVQCFVGKEPMNLMSGGVIQNEIGQTLPVVHRCGMPYARRKSANRGLRYRSIPVA